MISSDLEKNIFAFDDQNSPRYLSEQNFAEKITVCHEFESVAYISSNHENMEETKSSALEKAVLGVLGLHTRIRYITRVPMLSLPIRGYLCKRHKNSVSIKNEDRNP